VVVGLGSEGSGVGRITGAGSKSIGVAWQARETGDRCSSSSVSLSCSSWTSHQRLVAFCVHLAGNVVASAWEGAFRGVDVGGDVTVGWDDSLSNGGAGIFTAAAGAHLLWRQRTLGGVLTSAGGVFRRQEMVISLLPAWWLGIRCVGKAWINTLLAQSEKVLPRDGCVVGAHAISHNAGPGGCRSGDGPAAR
jgi:hypothetical protein